jgi:hypothetical protein
MWNDVNDHGLILKHINFKNLLLSSRKKKKSQKNHSKFKLNNLHLFISNQISFNIELILQPKKSLTKGMRSYTVQENSPLSTPKNPTKSQNLKSIIYNSSHTNQTIFHSIFFPSPQNFSLSINCRRQPLMPHHHRIHLSFSYLCFLCVSHIATLASLFSLVGYLLFSLLHILSIQHHAVKPLLFHYPSSTSCWKLRNKNYMNHKKCIFLPLVSVPLKNN